MFPRKAPEAAPAPLCPGISVPKRGRPRAACLASVLGLAGTLAIAYGAPLRAAAASGDTCAAPPARPASASIASADPYAAASAPAASVAASSDTCVAPRTRLPEASPCKSTDTCRTRPAPRTRAADAGDPFLAAALGALPLVSGFYVSASPVKGAAFTLADLMLICAIVQIRSDADRPPKDAAPYYWLLAGVNLADAVLSALQVESDAAKRISVNVNPSDRPGIILGWRF